MDSEIDKPSPVGEEKNSAAVADGAQNGQSRRQFTRAAAISGAVVLSLGNRAAWGGQASNKACLSTSFLNSLDVNGLHSAAPESVRLEVEEFRAFQNHPNAKGPFTTNKGGAPQTCYAIRKNGNSDFK